MAETKIDLDSQTSGTLPPNHGGTGSVSPQAEKSVAFVGDSSGSFAADSRLQFDVSNGHLTCPANIVGGFPTVLPFEVPRVEVIADQNAAAFLAINYGSDNPSFVGIHGGGSQASPTASPNGSKLVLFTGIGHDGTGLTFSGSGGEMQFVTSETWSSGAQGTEWKLKLCANGSATHTDVLSCSAAGLSVDGSLSATGSISAPAGVNGGFTGALTGFTSLDMNVGGGGPAIVFTNKLSFIWGTNDPDSNTMQLLPSLVTIGGTGTAANLAVGASSSSGYKFLVSGTTALNGTLTIADGSQAAGYVLTSNAAGLASWQPAYSGASGTFTTVDAKTVTVTNGIITSIV